MIGYLLMNGSTSRKGFFQFSLFFCVCLTSRWSCNVKSHVKRGKTLWHEEGRSSCSRWKLKLWPYWQSKLLQAAVTSPHHGSSPHPETADTVTSKMKHQSSATIILHPRRHPQQLHWTTTTRWLTRACRAAAAAQTPPNKSHSSQKPVVQVSHPPRPF